MPTALSPTSRRRRRPPATRGFTLVEIGVVTLIIGVLASLTMPALKRTLIATRANAAANDLRTFAAAFQSYEQQNGRYPPDASSGSLPPLMVGSLGNTSWRRITPVGGYYDWEYNRIHAGVRYKAGISIRTRGTIRVTTNRELLVAIDRLIDNGDLTTGNFILGAGNEPFLAIER
jgi:prepilin-type N-terminal cleavage/methylation domain-containing protein